MTEKIFEKKILHLSVIFLIILVSFFQYLNIHTMPARGDAPDIVGVHTSDLMALLAIYPFEIRKIIDEYHQFPFWSPYRLGGTPIFAKPQAAFFYINLPLILYAPTVFAGIKWSILLHYAIAAAAMYALMRYLSKNNLASFVAAFTYTFNGYIVSRLNWGQTNIIYPYAWIPLIFLFTLIGLESGEWLASSIMTGIMFSLAVLGGGAQLFLYTIVLYSYFLLCYYALNLSRKKIIGMPIRISKMLIVSIVVFFGLTAVFVLPDRSLVNAGVRSQGYSYEQSVGGLWSIDFTSLKGMLIYPHLFKKPHSDWDSTGLGLIPFLLALLSIFYAKKKKVLLFLLLVPIVILVLQGSFLYYIFWKLIPQFRQIKGIFKGYAIFYFLMSILAGYGFMYLLEITGRLKKYSRSIIVCSAIALLIVNLTFFNNKLTLMTDIKYEISKNQVLNYMANDKDIFRFRIFETNGIDWGTDHYSVLMGLNDVYGTENVWLTDYLPVYLSYANRYPAKGYGILNTKYIVSMQELNITDYKFVKKFEECGYYGNGADICQPRKSDGPYLYQNEKFLPRAYFASHGILVVGEKNSVDQMAYYIMSSQDFNPADSVVVHGYGSINSYEDSFLKNFDAIILTQNSIDRDSGPKLANYANSGGILIPNVLAGEASITAEAINKIIANISANMPYGNSEKAEIPLYSPNKVTISTKGKKGFLVLSEQFSLYPGWKAYGEDGNAVSIYRADGVISAVNLHGDEQKITFAYKEPLFAKGAIISLSTMLLILAYYTYYFRKRHRNIRSSQN